MPSVTGFIEINLNPDKDDHPNLSRMSRVRDTLRRRKVTKKVINFKYEDDQTPPLDTLISEDNPPTNPFDCKDAKCEECFPQFFPATTRINDSIAQQTMSTLGDTIQENIAFLRDALTNHADFIVTRWRKKSRDKRYTFLEAHSALYPKKWAAVHLLNAVNYLNSEEEHVYYTASRREVIAYHPNGEVKKAQRPPHPRDPEGVVSRFRHTWFLPCLDAEMLSEDPLLLLALLHHRTFNEPEKWISFDSSQVALAECFGPIDHVFNAQCVVVQGPDYGKLVKWNAQQMHRREIMGFTKAYFVFTAQNRMMSLLTRLVSALLAEANEAPVNDIHPKWSQLINTDFSRFGTTSGWSTDSIKPFSAPPSFDPTGIIDLIASRHRAVRDEVKLLQTDPAYVQFGARELASAHFFETWSGSDRWPYFVDELICVPLRREMYWRQLVVESKHMGEWLQVVQDSPSDTEARTEYEHMLYVVWNLCLETFSVFESDVKGSLLYQRGFEKNLDIEGDAKLDKSNRKYSEDDYFPDDMLYWAVSTLGYDKYRSLSMDPSLNFTIIDYLCRTDRKEAARISQSLLVLISDIAVLFEMMSSITLRSFREIPISRKHTKKLFKEEHRGEFMKKMKMPFTDLEIGDKLGEFLERACTQYPWPRGRKSQEWLAEAEAAQEALDIKEDIDGLMNFSRGEKHLEELATQREYVRCQLERSKKQALDIDATPQTVWGEDTSSSSSFTPVARKTRTRSPPSLGQDSGPPSRTVESPATPTPQLEQIKIAVRRDNIAIFKAMFPEKGEDSSRSFAWQHFLAAMTDAGFSILQSQGSAVTLKLDRIEGEDKIVVHRPHPVATLHPIMLRAIAKRITKWFGWDKETIVEREE
ncbi:hypothetical protein E4T52_02919 [Aureobasidium sp. EXF-3400]|nr:hypothetical protein E4T52_02919 [Aureobasidium sp. EXF-3400]